MSEPQITPEIGKLLMHGLAIEGLSQSQLSALQGLPTIDGLTKEALRLTQEGRGNEALRLMAGLIIPWTQQDVVAGLKENLSSQKRDSNGERQEPQKGTAEWARYDEAKKIAEACLEYLKSGTGEIPEALTDAVANFLAQNPVFHDLLYEQQAGQKPTLRTDVAKAIANNLLRQPEVRRRLHQLFTDRLDPTKRLGHAAEVDRLRQELEELSRQVVLKSEDQIRQEISKKKQDLDRKLMQLNDPQTAKAYSEYQQIKLALQEVSSLISDIENRRITDEKGFRRRIDTLNSSYNLNIDRNLSLSDILTALKNTQQALRNTFATTPAFIRISIIEDDILKLQSEIQNLEQELSKATSEENRRLVAEYNKKKEQLADAEALLRAERIKYASEVIGIPAEAIQGYLDEALGSAAKHYKEAAKREAEKKEGEQRRLLESGLEKLGQRLGRTAKKQKGETRFIPDKREARKWLTLLMQPGGVEKFMEEIFKDQNRLTDSTNGFGLTQAEAQEILAKKDDPEFIRKTGLELAKKVLADYLLAGGRLSRDDIIAMGNSEWVDSLINDGLKIVQQKRQQIENLVGKGVLTKMDEIKGGKSNREWLAANWWKLGLGILGLLILLGILGSRALH